MTVKGTMKAAICHKIEDVPIPEPTGREMRVRVKAASLCHLDIQFTSGAMDIGSLPQIIGHEAISVVDKVGPEAVSYGFQEGDLIGAAPYHDVCLACFGCKKLGSHFCKGMNVKGFTCPGYFAEYSLVDPEGAVVVARAKQLDRVSPNYLTPLFCSGITVWDALERACLRPGESLAIVGVGGLRSLATRYAQALGAHVIALDVQDEQIQARAKEGGANEILNTRSLSPEELNHQIALRNYGNPVDVAVETLGSEAAYDTALKTLRPEGRLIAVGVFGDSLPISGLALVANAFQIIGAKLPSRASIQRCIDFSLRKNILPRINPRIFRLEDINEMMALMETGKVHDGRMAMEVRW